MGMIRQLGTLIGVAVLTLALGTPAMGAKIDGELIEGSQLKLKQIDVTAPGAVAGTARCPKSKRLLTGGAFWHATGGGPAHAISNLSQLTSSAPTRDGRGWYADGMNNANESRTLTIEARCVPKGKLPGVTVRDQGNVLDTGFPGGVTADCPGDKVTMTGGAYLSKPGKGPSIVGARRGRITGSTLINSAEKWRVIGGNFSEGKLELHAIALCIAENKVDGVSINYPTSVVPDQSTGGGYGSCFGGTRALAVGTSWRRTGEQKPAVDLATSTYLSGNAPTFDTLGHYGAGLNVSGVSLNLDTAILCPTF